MSKTAFSGTYQQIPNPLSLNLLALLTEESSIEFSSTLFLHWLFCNVEHAVFWQFSTFKMKLVNLMSLIAWTYVLFDIFFSKGML